MSSACDEEMVLQSMVENVAHSLNVECSYEPLDSLILIHVKLAADVTSLQFVEVLDLACLLTLGPMPASSEAVTKVLYQMSEEETSEVDEARHTVRDDMEAAAAVGAVVEWSTAARVFVPWRPVVYFEGVSCMAVQGAAPRKEPQRRAETHISDPVGRSSCIAHQGNFDSLNTVSSIRYVNRKHTFRRRQ